MRLAVSRNAPPTSEKPMGAKTDYLDTVETEALVAALTRRSPALIVIMHRPGNPDDGADKLSIFFETHSCCPVHNCINASHLLTEAQDQMLTRLDQHLEGKAMDHAGELTDEEMKELRDIFGEGDESSGG